MPVQVRPLVPFIDAGIAQLVERNLAKVDVAGSSPVSRSIFLPTISGLPKILPEHITDILLLPL